MSDANFIRTYRNVAIGLYVLLAATILCARLHIGFLAAPIALAIASTKAILVALYFMRLRHSSGIIRLFATGGLFWLVILIGLTLSDAFNQ